MIEATTPLMRQYQAIKKRYPNALVFFRLGDFYELFYEDAIVASRELQITLTSRNRERGEPIPMESAERIANRCPSRAPGPTMVAISCTHKRYVIHHVYTSNTTPECKRYPELLYNI